MDIKIIFIKTAKGGDEFKNKTSFLSGDYKRVLGLVDDKSTVEELIKRAAPSLRGSFNDMLQKLANDGFIQDGSDGTKDKESHEAKVNPSQVKPSKLMLKMAIPVVRSEREDLDFTSIMAAPDSGALAANEAKAKAQEAEQEKIRHTKFEAEAKARTEAETARLKAEQEAAKAKAELAATQARMKQEAEAKARAEAETARLKAEQEAVRAKAELVEMQATTKAAHLAGSEPHTLLPEDKVAQARADEEARQLAESQSSIWVEAEQRAKVQAQQADEMQHKAQKVEKITPAPVITRARKKPRQPFPLGKIIVCVLGLFVVLSLLLPFVWPMLDFISKFELNLTAQLHQPVHIGHMRAQLLPLPKLELQAVSVGSGEELRAASVVLNFSVIDLFAFSYMG